jgi:hypothetical protein
MLVGYLGLTLVMLLSMAGPLLIGRWLADREPDPDPELEAIEAHALVLLSGDPSAS